MKNSGRHQSQNGSVEPSGPRVGVGAVVIRDGRVLLVKRAKEPGRGYWAIPGGVVELGESLREAAEREIMEETGVVIRAREPIVTFEVIQRGRDGRVQFHYVIVDLAADYVSGEPHPADDAQDAQWFTPEEVQNIPLTRNTLELLRNLDFLA